MVKNIYIYIYIVNIDQYSILEFDFSSIFSKSFNTAVAWRTSRPIDNLIRDTIENKNILYFISYTIIYKYGERLVPFRIKK